MNKGYKPRQVISVEAKSFLGGQEGMRDEDKPGGIDLRTEEKDANQEHCVRPLTEVVAETKMGQENWESYDWDNKTWNSAQDKW